jgi:hypothetical protein
MKDRDRFLYSVYIWEALSMKLRRLVLLSKVVSSQPCLGVAFGRVCISSFRPCPIVWYRTSVSALVFPATVPRSKASQLVSLLEKRPPFSFSKRGRPRCFPSSLAKWLQRLRLRRPFIGTSIRCICLCFYPHAYCSHLAS